MNPTPTAFPTVLHVVMDGSSPVWLQPLLTGAFVLAAALVALTSLWLSDRRKLRREDLRQWDSELRDVHTTVSASVRTLELKMTHFVGFTGSKKRMGANLTSDEIRELELVAREAEDVLAASGARLELIAVGPVEKRLAELSSALNEVIYNTINEHSGQRPDSWDWLLPMELKLSRGRQDFTDAVRTSLSR